MMSPRFFARFRELKRSGDPKSIEAEDIAIAEKIVKRTADCMLIDIWRMLRQGKLGKIAARRLRHLVALQRDHYARVRWNGRGLIDRLIWAPKIPNARPFAWDDAVASRARKIDFVLALHDITKINLERPGGINAHGGHVVSTAVETRDIARELLDKDEALIQELMNLALSIASPYLSDKPYTARGDLVAIDDVIVYSADALDYVDFWGMALVVCIRQHPQTEFKTREGVESVKASLAYAACIREEVCKRLCGLQLAGKPLEPLRECAIDYWKRSKRFIAFFNEQPPKTFMEFRAGLNEFLRQEFERGNLWRCISRRKPCDAAQGS